MEPHIELPSRQRPAVLKTLDGQSIELVADVTSIGRAIDNDLVLDGSGSSRHHARIVWEENRWFLIDLESTNGTLVSGQPVSRHELASGDQISIGDAVFSFHWEEHPEDGATTTGH